MFDANSEARLQAIHPSPAAKAREMEKRLALDPLIGGAGFDCHVSQGRRSSALQEAYYAQGRMSLDFVNACRKAVNLPPIADEENRHTVTNAAPGDSMHEYGFAFDLAIHDENGKFDWDASDARWRRVEAVGISVGLTAGCNFRTFPDAPHFQEQGNWPISPNSKMRAMLKDEGIQAVWDASGLQVPAAE